MHFSPLLFQHHTEILQILLLTHAMEQVKRPRVSRAVTWWPPSEASMFIFPAWFPEAMWLPSGLNTTDHASLDHRQCSGAENQDEGYEPLLCGGQSTYMLLMQLSDLLVLPGHSIHLPVLHQEHDSDFPP